ncbi:MAG: glycosyltransferase family 2 protein [Candidatus Omnitrophica bacterium]|nr:glycosyltransferase family 2 protein [Candidatus Omnitrophota bacterium]
MPSAATASVVIATYRRPQLVGPLLDALSLQVGARFQVVVVEQGEAMFQPAAYQSGRPFLLDYVCLPTPGLPHARNVGWQRSQGEWILFIDDDAIPAAEWVVAHLRHAADPAIGGVGGRIIEPTAAGRASAAQRRRYRTGAIRMWDAYPFLDFDAETPGEIQHVMGCNMSFRRACLEAAGGFDERFSGTAEFEELDLCLRARRLGYRLVFEPAALVRHERATTGGCRLPTTRQAFYWFHHNHQLLFLKHFPRRYYPLFLAEVLARIIWRTCRVGQPAYLPAGLQGVRDGITTYRRSKGQAPRRP